jgi:Tol biopolymer transport system component
VVRQPSFSADGRSVFFTLNAAGRDGVYRAALGRLGEFIPVAQLSNLVWVELSTDIRSLYYSRDGDRGAEVVRRSLDGSGTAEEVLIAGIANGSQRVSPDGRWIAFIGREQGTGQLFLRSTDPARTERWSVFRARAWGDVGWAANGRALYFVASGAMRVARLSAGEAPAVERVDSLFAMDGYLPTFALAPDGRFLLTRLRSGAGGNRLTLVSDWRALLRRP